MFHLTPQERSAVITVCFIVFAGTLIHVGMQKDLRVFNWLHISQKGNLVSAININQAAVEDLLKVPGIGPKTAEYILNYRKRNGAFKSLEPLKGARGMSLQRYERVTKYFKI